MSSVNMKGDILIWYKWIHQNAQFTSCDSFTKSLDMQFDPLTYETTELFKFC